MQCSYGPLLVVPVAVSLTLDITTVPCRNEAQLVLTCTRKLADTCLPSEQSCITVTGPATPTIGYLTPLAEQSGYYYLSVHWEVLCHPPAAL